MKFGNMAWNTYTTKPWEDDGTDTDILIPWSILCSLRMAMFRCISASDFGAFIVAAPRYVTPEKIVHSWSISETKRFFVMFVRKERRNYLCLKKI